MPRHSEGLWIPGVNSVGTDLALASWVDGETLHALGQENRKLGPNHAAQGGAGI